MKPFAKLYETTEYGQVLVMLDQNDDGNPAISFHAKPEDLGVCSTSLAFPDTEDGWDKAEAVFESIDEDVAKKGVADIFRLSGIAVVPA
ncbi:hypothetical protein K5M36_16990 [Chromobacterium vaccinii]|nr:hypothetical protein [Chromobacterium vaccinii]